MKPFKLDDKMILQARDYIPIAEKKEFVDHCADRCFDQINVVANNGAEDGALPMMYKENNVRKSRCLMAALAKLYLLIDVKTEPDDPWMVTEEEYDRLAGSHIQNQLERAKGDAELRGKVFDLLGDYKDLERRLNSEIHALAAVMNDPASRIICAMSQAMSSATLEEAKVEFDELMGKMADYKKKQEAGESNA